MHNSVQNTIGIDQNFVKPSTEILKKLRNYSMKHGQEILANSKAFNKKLIKTAIKYEMCQIAGLGGLVLQLQNASSSSSHCEKYSESARAIAGPGP